MSRPMLVRVHFDLNKMIVSKIQMHRKNNSFRFMKAGIHDSLLFIISTIRNAEEIA